MDLHPRPILYQRCGCLDQYLNAIRGKVTYVADDIVLTVVLIDMLGVDVTSMVVPINPTID
jgi:hypothetical protein